MGLSRKDIAEEAAGRRERIRTFMSQEQPLTIAQIKAMEGMHERALRALIKEIDDEFELNYSARIRASASRGEMPFGLTTATGRLRQKLADACYALRERGNDSAAYGRNQVAPIIGLNARQQKKAEERPFTHDWTLSQIERLARASGRDPTEFLLSCLTT